MKIRVCPECGQHNLENAWSCVSCGTTLPVKSLIEIDDKDAQLESQRTVADIYHQTRNYDEDAQQESSQEPQSQAPISIPSQPKKSNKKTWVIVGIAGIVVAVLCIFSVISIAVTKVYTEKAPVEMVLDAHMRHMANKDADSAYALFSPRGQRQIPISDLEELLEGINFIFFEGYQSLSVSNLNISAFANKNPDMPQGTVAEVTGFINYEGGIQGTFNGTLEKVSGEWMIYSISVTVPPSKIK